MKINLNTIPKKEIFSKVISLKKIDKNTVMVGYDKAWHPDYVTMDKAKELSKKYKVKILG